jgi:hypothetical protein
LRLRHAVIPIAVLSAVPLAGCGTKTLDTSQIETQLKQKIGTQTPVKSVSCPDSVDAKKGDTFNCTLTAASGHTYTLKVLQTDDNGHVTVQSTTPAK